MNGGRSLYGINVLRPREEWQPRAPYRLANEAESQRIVESAPEEFARLYLASRLLSLRAADLGPLLIEHVDFENVRFKLPGFGVLPIGDELQPILHTAIDGRKNGPVFLSQRGKPWNRNLVTCAGRKARNRARVSQKVLV